MFQITRHFNFSCTSWSKCARKKNFPFPYFKTPQSRWDWKVILDLGNGRHHTASVNAVLELLIVSHDLLQQMQLAKLSWNCKCFHFSEPLKDFSSMLAWRLNVHSWCVWYDRSKAPEQPLNGPCGEIVFFVFFFTAASKVNNGLWNSAFQPK